MSENKMAACEFTKKFKHKDIKKALKDFALLNKTEFPDEIIDCDKKIMILDVLKVGESEIFLPIVIRSNGFLKLINKVSKTDLRSCLRDEAWPFFNRIELIGGLLGVRAQKTEQSLYSGLKYLVDYWATMGYLCSICISDRAEKLLKSNDAKKLKKLVEIIILPERFREKKIVFNSVPE